MLEIFCTLLFSFTCSAGFGVVFGIRPKELGYAGLVGLITRVALILCQLVSANRLVYTLVGALVGALFAELLARYKNTVITKYLYPAMVPIIPGDLFYNTIMAIVTLNGAEVIEYGGDLVLALLGIALGTMIAPMILHSKNYMYRALVGHH